MGNKIKPNPVPLGQRSIASLLLKGTALGNWLAGGEFKRGTEVYTDGYGVEREYTPEFKETAQGQELKQIGDTSKTAGKIVATGLTFENPSIVEEVWSPIMTRFAFGLKDATERVTNMVKDPNARTGSILKVNNKEVKKYQQSGELPDPYKWNIEWLSNRKDKLDFVMHNYDDVVKRIKSIKYINESWDNIQKIVGQSNSKNSKVIGGYHKASDHTVHLPSTFKVVKDGTVYEGPIDMKSLNPWNIVHETAHGAFLPLEQDGQIKSIIGNQYKDPYLDSPTEINSRLMEMRYINRIDPKHTFNKEEVRKLKLDPNFKDRDILKRYDEETVSRLLNEVASIESQYNLVPFAKLGIKIKPENRGKFTALKKRTGKSSTWYKEHGTPAQKKMAIFALNSLKWKH